MFYFSVSEDIKIAADTEILFANYVGNRNENFWNNSNSYVPERFTDKNNNNMKLFDVFCPFRIYSEDFSSNFSFFL